MSNRVEFIDVAKGISIMLVAMFHSPLREYYSEIIDPMSLFRMPLFFFLSGVFFVWTIAPKEFLVKKSEALLKPYYSVLLTLWLLNFLMGEPHFLYELKGILYGNGDTIEWEPLWFLPHLFVVYGFGYLLLNHSSFIQWSYPKKYLFLILMFSIGVFSIELFWYRDVVVMGKSITLPGLPMSLDVLLISSACFLLGYLAKDKLLVFNPSTLLFVLAGITFVGIAHFTNASLDLNRRIFEEPIIGALGTVCGIYIVLSLSWYISRVKWLAVAPSYFGKASLYILIFHLFISKETFSILSDGQSDESILLGYAFLSFALSMVIPLIIQRAVISSDVLSLAFLPFRSNNLVKKVIVSR